MWPENWDTVQLFLLVQTQWRTGPMGSVIGLDYVAVDAAIRMSGITITPETFDGLRIMESAALEAMSSET